jgi:hypothetical protein
MCRECVVGPWAQTKVVYTQIWKEMAAEEKAGMTPMIPLAEDIVYRPFEEWVREQEQIRLQQAALRASQNSVAQESQSAAARAPTGLLRQPPQSFAAQQRAQGRPATTSTSSKSREDAPAPVSLSSRPKVQKENAPVTKATEATDPVLKSVRGSVRTKLPSSAAPSESQTVERPARSVAVPVSSHRRQKSESIRPATLFSPTEQQIEIASTKPDVILQRLQKLQTELERALNARTMAIISSRTVAPPHPHVVVKWVDYTNKFGLGYILNDGSVGCILRDIPTTEGSKTAMLPPAGVFIRGAEQHILRRQDAAYEDRNQPVPMKESIKFFENNAENGLSEVTVSPENFRVSMLEDGTAGKMNPGKDIYQHRKRERIILWKKFANYMIAYGRDEALLAEEAGMVGPGRQDTMAELVTFYQRFGDVGCWVFCDGHIQVCSA